MSSKTIENARNAWEIVRQGLNGEREIDTEVACAFLRLKNFIGVAERSLEENND